MVIQRKANRPWRCRELLSDTILSKQVGSNPGMDLGFFGLPVADSGYSMLGKIVPIQSMKSVNLEPDE